jgi:hypothetical protein
MVIPTFINNSKPVRLETMARQTDQEINSLIFIFFDSFEETLVGRMVVDMPDSDRLYPLGGF